jgi:hypothetical protein
MRLFDFWRKTAPVQTPVDPELLNKALEIFKADAEIYNQAVEEIYGEVPGATQLVHVWPTDDEGIIKFLKEMGKLDQIAEMIVARGRGLNTVREAKIKIVFNMPVTDGHGTPHRSY